MTHHKPLIAEICGGLYRMGERFTLRPGVCLGLFIFLTMIPGYAQNQWDSSEVNEIFAGIEIEMDSAIWEIQAKGITPYDFGRSLISDGKIDEARQWFTLLEMKGSASATFGLAWIEFTTGNYFSAKQMALKSLNENHSATLNARNFYLLGSIALELAEIQDSESYFTEAYYIYKTERMHGGMFLSLTGLARVATAQSQFSRAFDLLRMAQNQNDALDRKGGVPYSEGRLQELEAEIHLAQGEIHTAHELLLQASETYRYDLELGLGEYIIKYSTTGKSPANDKGSVIEDGAISRSISPGPDPRDDKDSKTNGNKGITPGPDPADDKDSFSESEESTEASDTNKATTPGPGPRDDKDSKRGVTNNATSGPSPKDHTGSFTETEESSDTDKATTPGPRPRDDKDSKTNGINGISPGPGPADDKDSFSDSEEPTETSDTNKGTSPGPGPADDKDSKTGSHPNAPQNVIDTQRRIFSVGPFPGDDNES